MRGYKIRPLSSHKGKVDQWGITIPAVMAEAIPDTTTFIPQWHEDGILLQQVNNGEPAADTLPEWVAENQPKPKPKRRRNNK